MPLKIGRLTHLPVSRPSQSQPDTDTLHPVRDKVEPAESEALGPRVQFTLNPYPLDQLDHFQHPPKVPPAPPPALRHPPLYRLPSLPPPPDSSLLFPESWSGEAPLLRPSHFPLMTLSTGRAHTALSSSQTVAPTHYLLPRCSYCLICEIGMEKVCSCVQSLVPGNRRQGVSCIGPEVFGRFDIHFSLGYRQKQHNESLLLLLIHISLAF